MTATQTLKNDDPLTIDLLAVHVRPGDSGSNEPYVAGLLTGLAKLPASTVRVRVFARDWLPGWPTHGPGTTLDFVPVRSLPLGTQLSRLLLEWWIAARTKADVLLFPGTTAAPFARAPQVSVVHWDNRLQPHSAPRLRHLANSFMMRLIRARAARVVVPTQSYADFLRGAWGFDREKLVSVHHGVEAPHALRAMTPVDQTGVVAVLNDLPHKNLGTLLRAWSLVLLDAAKPLALTLVGPISERSLDQTATPWRAWETEGRLVRHRRLDHPDVLATIAHSAVLVAPSEAETFCLPLIEAMAVGTAVVTADTDVAREVCGESAVFVAPRDERTLANAVVRLLDDQVRRVRLGDAGMARANSFTWERAAEATFQALRDAVESSLH